MLSNKMLDAILEELGLEKDEEFEIKNVCYNHRINKNGLEYCFDDHWDRSIYLGELLLGELEIIKLPFVPKIDEGYYYVDIALPCLSSYSNNRGDFIDKHRIKNDLCFEIREEATAKAKWLLKQKYQ